VTPQSGGLQVVPDTNNDATQTYLQQQYPNSAASGDWLQLHPRDRFIGKGVLLKAEPGDMILWDSRTLHGGLVGTGENLPNDYFARLSLTVCMAPSTKAKDSIIKNRKLAVEKGWALTHWPYEFRKSGMGNSDARNIKNFTYKMPNLTPEQMKLVGEVKNDK